MAESVGSIYYEVDADTAKLLEKVPQVEKATDKLGKTFDKTGKSAAEAEFKLTKTAQAAKTLADEAQNASGALNAISGVMAGLLTLQGAKSIVSMADAYTDMQNRLRLVTEGQEQLAVATGAVFRIAQETSQAVGATAQVYQRFAQNAKSLGLNLDDVARLTLITSKAVAVSGADAAAADAAMRQFGQALSSGALRGDEFNSVLEQTPGLAEAIAKGLGVPVGKLREMAAEGQLTAQAIIKALTAAADDVDAKFGTRIKTVAQSVTELQNALLQFVGEANTSSGATSVLASAIGALAKNLQGVADVLLAVGAGAMARFIAQLGVKTIATMKAWMETRKLALEEVNLARAQVAATQAAVTEAAGWSANALTKAQAAARTDALTAAQTRLAVATRASGTVIGTLTGLLGGPVGIIGLVASVAAGMYLMRDSTDTAKVSLDGFEVSAEAAKQKLGELKASQQETVKEMLKKNAAEAVQELDAALDKLSRGTMVSGGQTQWTWINYAGSEMQKLSQQVRNGEITSAQFDAKVNELINRFADANNASEKWRAAMRELLGTTDSAIDKSNKFTAALNNVSAAAGGAAGAVAGLKGEMAGISGDPGKYLKSLTESFAKLQDGGSRLKEAERLVMGWGDQVDPRLAKQILATAAATDSLAASQKAATSARSGANKEANTEKRHAEENAKALNKLAKELEQASMAGEQLAAAKARSSLNKFASPKEIAEAERLGAALLKVGEAEKNLEVLKKLGTELGLLTLSGRELAIAQAELQLNKYATPGQIEDVRALAGAMYDANQQKKLLDQVGADPTKYVQGDVKPLTGGAFDDQAARYGAEAVAEQERYAAQLTRLQEALAAQAMTLQEGFDLQESLYQTHTDRMNQIDDARTQVMLGAASNAFGQVASATKQFAGEQSGIYKAMFAASKAFSIAQSIVAIQTGIAQAAALPWPANLPAMASVVAATAGIVSTISGTNYSGGRQYGGPVAQGGMYRINETGAPEVLNMANGKQYLLPNSRGEVVSNKDATTAAKGQGATNLTVQLIEDSSRGGQVDQGQLDEQGVLRIFVASIRKGGEAAQAMEGTYGVVRRGR